MKILINYATPNFATVRKLNSATGLSAGEFEKVIEYSPDDLDEAFRQSNESILNMARGAGCWLWKPYIIKESLRSMKADDFLFYADAGSVFTGPVEPLIRVMQQTDQSVIAFRSNQIEHVRTKRDAFILMRCDTVEYADTYQVEAGFSLWRKTAFSMRLVNEWLSYVQDERVITDMPNQCGKGNYPGFKEHRYDQSIWSLLCKKHQVLIHRRIYTYKIQSRGLHHGDEDPNSTSPCFVFVHRNNLKEVLRFYLTAPLKFRLKFPVFKDIIFDPRFVLVKEFVKQLLVKVAPRIFL